MIAWLSYSAGLALVVGRAPEVVHHLLDARGGMPREIDPREAHRFIRAAPDLQRRPIAESHPYPTLLADLRTGWQADSVISAILVVLDEACTEDEREEMGRLTAELLMRRDVRRRAAKLLHGLALPMPDALPPSRECEPLYGLLRPLVENQRLVCAMQEAWTLAIKMTGEDPAWADRLRQQTEEASYRVALLDALREDGHLRAFSDYRVKYAVRMAYAEHARVGRFLDVWFLQLVVRAGAQRALEWLSWYARHTNLPDIARVFTEPVTRALLRTLRTENPDDILMSAAIQAFSGPLTQEFVPRLAAYISIYDPILFAQAFEVYWNIRTAMRSSGAAPAERDPAREGLVPFVLVPPGMLAVTFDHPPALMFEHTVIPITTPYHHKLGLQLDNVRQIIGLARSGRSARAGAH